MSFELLGHFIQVVEFIGINLPIIFPYYPVNTFRIYSDFTSLTPNAVNLCSHFFSPYKHHWRFINFNDLKNQLLISLIFSSVFVPNLLISTLIFITSFLLCILHLTCSSFPVFLIGSGGHQLEKLSFLTDLFLFYQLLRQRNWILELVLWLWLFLFLSVFVLYNLKLSYYVCKCLG